MSNDIIIKTQRLHHKLKPCSYPISKVEAKCYQLSGHLSNDEKQVNILTGQGSCSVAHTMPCCMVSKNELGRPPLLARLRLRRTAWSLTSTLTDKMVTLISQWAGQPLYPYPPTRVGELSFTARTHAQWNRLTVGGRNILNAEERNEERPTSRRGPHSMNQSLISHARNKTVGLCMIPQDTLHIL